MKIFLTVLLVMLSLSCSKKEEGDTDSNTSRTETTDRTEEEAPREIKDPEQVVISALLSELQMGLSQNDLDENRANSFVNAEICESMRVYMDHFGIGGCSHSCEETTFNRSCSGQSFATQCNQRKYNVNYTKHLMKWDLSTLSSSGEGISTYSIDSSGTVARDGEGVIKFDCSMEIKGRNDRTFSIISCGQSLNLNCNIMGKDYECRDLLKYVVRQKECAKSQ